ncbi:MAG TPA: XrtB/PEP-CTERM-associated polysaccharide biosynthesis outer membrane protein EpsL [Burkholderiales bacterium]|nr:XrtB/PEP-CTERM-associated polysaccharide biosynthesis outer membrane protein EpsL [Burkholderiales bacterium]
MIPENGRKTRAAFRALLSIAAWLFISGSAQAFFDDKLKLQMSENLNYDSNVFRISGNVNPATFIGSTDKSDVIRITKLSLDLNLSVSRQNFDIGYSLNQTRYTRFVDQDFDGHDGHANWLWQLGNRLNGQIGFNQSLALGSFANLQARVANPVQTTQALANATYTGVRWHVEAGVTQTRQSNGNPALRVTDFDTTDPELSLVYVSPSNNSAGISLQLEDGRYPNRDLISNNLLDSDYLQHSYGALFSWQLTGHSLLSGHVDRISKDYRDVPQQNFDGTTYVVNYSWTPTGHLIWSASYQRQLSAILSLTSNFALTKGISSQLAWTPTSKLKAGANFNFTTQDYLQQGLQPDASPQRTDITRSAGFDLSYAPLQDLAISFNFVHENRTSSILTGDYLDNLSTVNVQLSF